jgi:hypothetical protein
MLIELYKAKKVDFQHVVTFNMDEYVNLPEAHPESYHSFMHNNFFKHVNVKPENIHILNGNADDLESESPGVGVGPVGKKREEGGLDREREEGGAGSRRRSANEARK